jgi:alpha-glucosidase
MVLSMSLSGQLICGPDIGGFIDPSEGDADLFARWMGVGCLLPFARAHVAEGSIDKEPWSFGAACEATCRRAIELRYQLLPYFYTLAWRAHRTGAALAAPLFFADPTDPAVRREDRAFLVGEDLLVVCDVTPPGEADDRPIALPKPVWPAVQLTEPDPHLPELRVRPGAAVPTGPVMQFSDERPTDPLTVVAAPGPDGLAEGLLYEDAGDGFGFERGEYRLSRIAVDASDRERPTIELVHLNGDRAATQRDVRVRVVAG